MTNQKDRDENYGIEEPLYDEIRNLDVRAAVIIHGVNGYVVIPTDMERIPSITPLQAEHIKIVDHSKWGSAWELMAKVREVVGADPKNVAWDAFRDKVQAAKDAAEAEKKAEEAEHRADEARENPA